MTAPWFGELPQGWRNAPLKRIVSFTAGGTPDTENPEYWADSKDGTPWVTIADMSRVPVVRTTERAVTLAGQRSRSLTIAPAGSILFAMYASVGAISVLGVDATFNQAMLALTPKTGVDPRHVRYALETIRPHLGGLVRSNTQDNLNADQVANLFLPLPPPDIQRRVADFLDRETAQIDAMIEAQGYLVDKLEERRRALTTEIVGSVPLDTKLGRLLKHHIRGVRQGWSPQCHPYPRSDHTEWAVLRTGCVNGGRFNPEDNKALPEALRPRPETVVRQGEIVMSRANTRELLGSAAVVPAEHPRLMLSDKLYALDALPHANPWFIAGVLGTRRLRDLIEIAATGASQSMQNISQFDIVNLPMELPSRNLQDEAVTRLAVARHRIDDLASAAVDAITLMQERRSALISAVVTGRIDPCTGKETTPEKVRELA